MAQRKYLGTGPVRQLSTDNAPRTPETQRTPGKINTLKKNPWHVTLTLPRTQDHMQCSSGKQLERRGPFPPGERLA